MVKILRKYNKWLVAGFGSFLLVTWLVSGSGTLGGDPTKRVVATLAGRKIKALDMLHAEQEFRALKDYVPGVMTMRVGIESGAHWMLLTEQATAAGMVGDKGDGESWFDQLVQQEAQYEVLGNPQYRGIAEYILNNPQMMSQFTQQTQQRLTMMKDRARGPLQPDEFRLALAKLRGVLRMVDMFQHAPRLSDVRMIDVVSKFSTRVSFDAVVIPAAKMSGAEVPSDAKLAELFEKYKNVRKGTGEMGFGYQLPKRVKAEWLTLNKAAIAAAVVLDPVEVSKHWQQNREKFKGEFAAERSNVETALRQTKVDATFAEADRIVRARVRSASRGLETSGGVKKLPADWDVKRPKMEDIGRSLVQEVTTMKLPLPEVQVKAADHVAIEDFRTLGSIAFAQFRVGTQSGTIEEFLAQTYELSKSNTLGLQVGIPFEQPLVDSEGNRYYVCVLDAKLESPAESLEKVREQVMADAKQLAGYEKLKADAQTLQVLAMTDGLEGVAKMFATPAPAGSLAGTPPTDLTIDRRVVVSKQQGDQAYPQYDTQELRDALEAQVNVLGVTTKVTPENLAQRTLTVPLPARQGLAVIQITGHEPLSVEVMRTASLAAANGMMTREVRDQLKDQVALNPFEFETLKKNMAFVDLDRTETVKEQPAPAKKESEETKPAGA
jgi:hypothetical protein